MSDDDQALDGLAALRLDWYHTSTFDDWPPTIDFESQLDDDVREMMGGDQAATWAREQSTKALHVGTYESSIHNMLRRISEQEDWGKQFYLYRVHLKLDAVTFPDWVPDSGNFVGDWHLGERFSPEVEVVRYVNCHEDPGRISLAIRPTAIDATQRLAIPLAAEAGDPWLFETVGRMRPLRSVGRERPRHRLENSLRAEIAAGRAQVLANRLPINLRDQFVAAATRQADSEPNDWAHYTFGLASLVEDWPRVLDTLDDQPTHKRPMRHARRPSRRSGPCAPPVR